MDNELIVNEKERKKEKRKLYRDIVFIVLFGLLIIWFTGSFLANRSNYNDNQELSSKTELVSRSVKNSNVNKINTNTYALIEETSISAVFSYDIFSYHTRGEYINTMSHEYLEGTLEIDLSLTTYQITTAIIYFTGYSFLADDYFEFSYEFDYYDKQVLNSRELYSILTYINFDGGEYDWQDSLLYLDTEEETHTSTEIEHREEFYFYFLNQDVAVNLDGKFFLSELYSEIDNYIAIKSIDQESYNVGYADGYNDGYVDGVIDTEDSAYEKGFVDGQKDTINEKGFKTLFNAIMNAPYNIFKGILNFEFLGVNLFSLFSFIFTTMLILWIVKIFKK